MQRCYFTWIYFYVYKTALEKAAPLFSFSLQNLLQQYLEN